MRLLFTLFLFIPFASFGQTRSVRVDKFTGDSTVNSSEELISFLDAGEGRKLKSHDLKFYILKTPSSAAIVFHAKPLGVLSTDNNKYIFIKLSTGETLKLKNGAKFNVATPSEKLSAYAILTNDEIIKLKTSKVTDIRIETSKFPLDYSIEDNNQDLVSKALIVVM